MTDTPVDSLAQALDVSERLVAEVGEPQWTDPTPCTDWSVRELVNHLAGGHRLFADILHGGDTPALADLQRQQGVGRLGDDPAAAYRHAAARLLAAFRQPGVLEQVVTLPIGPMPGLAALHLRTIETLVHSWDLAQAIDRPAAFPGSLALQSAYRAFSVRSPTVRLGLAHRVDVRAARGWCGDRTAAQGPGLVGGAPIACRGAMRFEPREPDACFDANDRSLCGGQCVDASSGTIERQDHMTLTDIGDVSRRTVFTEGQETFRFVVRDFLEQEVAPVYPSWLVQGMPSRDFWRRAAELGLLGVGVPAELGGGPGTDFRDSVVVTEEIQRLGLAIGGLRVQTDICMPYLLHYATADQQRRWVPRLTSGEAVIALAMSEPEAGSDIKSLSTRAVRDGDHYVVNGAKTFISNGFAADLVILAVKTDPGAGRDGLSLLMVDASTAGFERGRKLDKLGLQAQDLAELSFVDMCVPVDNLLGEENAGFSYLTSNLAQERLSIAINSQAAAAAALAWTIEALQGTKPSQAAKFALAECATDVAAGQALSDQALALLVDDQLTGAQAATAKLYCTELQSRVVARCLDLSPAATSYRGASRIGQAYLDGRVSRIYGGSSEIMKVIIAQQLGL